MKFIKLSTYKFLVLEISSYQIVAFRKRDRIFLFFL